MIAGLPAARVRRTVALVSACHDPVRPRGADPVRAGRRARPARGILAARPGGRRWRRPMWWRALAILEGAAGPRRRGGQGQAGRQAEPCGAQRVL